MANSIFEKYSHRRNSDFKQNESLDKIINELKFLLHPVQKEKQKEFEQHKYPLSFIIGSPRSGTTILLQWLASLGCFSYPTNFLNRFAYAPYIGALIQKILFDPDFDYSNEFSDINKTAINFDSNLGKSKGALATNEFQHFFRNYMNNFDPQYLDNKQIKEVDFNGIRKGLSSIESVFDKPFIVKLWMLQFNLINFYKHIPNSLFIYIKREPIYNMQSLFLARKKYYLDTEIWWSVKPKEYKKLKEMDVYHQIAGQVYYTNKSIENELQYITPEKHITINYEDFCVAPEKYFNNIREKFEANGAFVIPKEYKGASSFISRNKIKIFKSEIYKLEKAYNYFEKIDGINE
jgi:hypothetical protein